MHADGHMFTSGSSCKQPASCINPDSCAEYKNYCGAGAEEVEKGIWGGGMPCWTCADNLVLRPTIADAEWLCLQTLTVSISAVTKGHEKEKSTASDDFVGSV